LEAYLVRINESLSSAIRVAGEMDQTAFLAVRECCGPRFPWRFRTCADHLGDRRNSARCHGAVIPGAKVVATNEDNKSRWTTTSNPEGFFKFAAIPPATYSLRISQPDFETWTVTGIVVHPGDSLTVPKIALKVGKRRSR